LAIIDEFPEFKISAVIKREATATMTNGVITPGALSTVATVKALFWEGSAAEAFISERFKDVTSAAISVPVGTDIQKGDEVTVNGKTYHALDPDNVGAANEHILVALAVFG
jgi:hypothetical protein